MCSPSYIAQSIRSLNGLPWRGIEYYLRRSLRSRRSESTGFLIHNHFPERTALGPTVVAAEAALRSLIDKGGPPNAQWTARTKELHDQYGNERKSMALNAASRGAASATYPARHAACPAPAGQTSGGEPPRLAQRRSP
jgi:hypothetical protein